MSDKDVSEKKSSKSESPLESSAETTVTANIAADAKVKTENSTSTIKDTASPKEKSTVTSASANMKKPVNKKKATTGTAPVKKDSNKTATAALTLAAISIIGAIAHGVWQQQNSAQLLTLTQKNQQAIQQSQTQLKSSLSSEFNRQLQQQLHTSSQSQKSATKAHRDSEAQIQRLTSQITQLQQQVSLRQPSDWLIHEAEYLIRVAARTMWLERDTKAAIGLLRDADSRLKELEQPKFLAVRALINEDIESLALMPTLENQQAILTLMALNKQVPNLTLANVNLAQALDGPEEDFTLSDDVNDWQSNLAKTWQKFLNDFITVRRRTGMVEPLMTPTQQQHLRQNLSLKVQLVQWAASEQKSDIYQQSLLDIQQWLNEYFDMSMPINQKFYQSIEQLKHKAIYYDYPSDLSSLAAMKRLLNDTKQGGQQKKSEKDSSANKVQSEDVKKQAIVEPAEAIEEVPPKKSTTTEDKPASGGQI